MTQNKNKKGIAKKALSISLVAAMLATSNVPVWASGFEVEVPEAESFAEVQDVEDAAVLGAIATDQDVESNITIDSNVIYGETGIDVSGSLTDKANGTPLNYYSYGWRLAGTLIDIEGLSGTGKVEGSDATAMSVSSATLAAHPEVAGKVLELHVYGMENNPSHDFDVVVGSVTVAKQNLEKSVILLDKTWDKFVYDGQVFAYTSDGARVGISGLDVRGSAGTTLTTWNATQLLTYFRVTDAVDATNAGDDFTVTMTAKDVLDDGSNNPYTGTISVSKTIQKKDYANGDIIGGYAENQKYEYTGKAIQPEIEKATLTESKYDKESNTAGLGGNDLSNAIEKVETWSTDNTNVGKKNITIYWDAEKLTNFNIGNTVGVDVSNAFEIIARNLDNCSATVGTVPTGSLVTDVAKAGLVTIYDKDGNALSLTENDFALIVFDPTDSNKHLSVLNDVGTYSAEIIQKGNNTTGKIQNVTIKVDTSTSTATSEKTVSKEFTGSAITPSKSEFGDLTVKIFANNGTAGDVTTTHTLQPDQWEITDYVKNTNAGEAYAVVKVTAEGNLNGKVFNLPFTITPLKVTSKDIDVTDYVIYEKGIKDVAEYNVAVTVVAKGVVNTKTAITLDAKDFEVTQKFVSKNAVDQKIETTIKLLNKNYIYTGTNAKIVADEKTKIVAGALQDSFIKINPSSYVYTGGKIRPEFTVVDNGVVLEEGTDYEVQDVSLAVNAGTATLIIKGLNKYKDSSAKATYTITPASISDVKVEVKGAVYTGKQVRPGETNGTSIKVTLNGNDVTEQFEVAGYGENINAGTGTVTLKLVKGNKNFEGTSKTAEFVIEKAIVNGTLKVYNANGKLIAETSDKNGTLTTGSNMPSFKYDGTAKELSQVVFVPTGSLASKVTASDYEIKYVNNIYGDEKNQGNVYVEFKAGSNFTGNVVAFKDYVNDVTIKTASAKASFNIESLKFDGTNVTVNNGEYAEGLPVKPDVLVQFGGKTLVEGKDYKIDYTSATEVTTNKPYTVTVTGINGYDGSTAGTDLADKQKCDGWGIDKKDLANCTVTLKNGEVTVMNGTVKVPASKLNITKNSDGSYTVKPSTVGSKQYTGTATVAGVKAPEATTLRVTDRTTSTVSLAWDEVAGAEGYTIWFRSEYDTKVSRKIIQGGDVTSWTQNGLQPGTKYFYTIRAWVKDSEGKYVFGEQSPVQRGTTKPIAAQIKSVSAANGKVKVVLAGKAAGAEMYSMCYSKSADFDNFAVGIRTSYTTRTFSKTLAKGTYFVRVKSYRDLGNNKRVYGAWSNTMTVVVK